MQSASFILPTFIFIVLVSLEFEIASDSGRFHEKAVLRLIQQFLKSLIGVVLAHSGCTTYDDSVQHGGNIHTHVQVASYLRPKFVKNSEPSRSHTKSKVFQHASSKSTNKCSNNL